MPSGTGPRSRGRGEPMVRMSSDTSARANVPSASADSRRTFPSGNRCSVPRTVHGSPSTVPVTSGALQVLPSSAERVIRWLVVPAGPGRLALQVSTSSPSPARSRVCGFCQTPCAASSTGWNQLAGCSTESSHTAPGAGAPSMRTARTLARPKMNSPAQPAPSGRPRCSKTPRPSIRARSSPPRTSTSTSCQMRVLEATRFTMASRSTRRKPLASMCDSAVQKCCARYPWPQQGKCRRVKSDRFRARKIRPTSLCATSWRAWKVARKSRYDVSVANANRHACMPSSVFSSKASTGAIPPSAPACHAPPAKDQARSALRSRLTTRSAAGTG